MRTHGQYSRDKGKKNREKVKKFFENNPAATQSECAEELGLSSQTIIKHVAALRCEDE